MSTTKKKPVALDSTLKELVEAVRSQNAGQREQRDLLEMIAKGVCDCGTISVLLVPVAYDGESYSLTSGMVADIQAAKKNNIMPVLQIKHGACLYFVPLSNELTSGNSVVGYQFYTDEHCPFGAPGVFTINVAKGIISYNVAEYVTEPAKNFAIRIGEDATAAVIRERLLIAESVVASVDIGSLG